MKNIIDSDQRNFDAAGSSSEGCSPALPEDPFPEYITVKLRPDVAELLDDVSCYLQISLVEAAELFLVSQLNQAAIGGTLEDLGLSLYTRIPCITPYLPVSDSMLNDALRYLEELVKGLVMDHAGSPEEVTLDA